MRRLLAGLVLAFAAAFPARADETGERTFTVEIGGRDDELREDCSRRLGAWWEEMTAPDRPPASWSEKDLGPWSLVARTSGGGFVEERPGVVHVVVNVVAEGLRSRSATADAYAAALMRGLRERVGLCADVPAAKRSSAARVEELDLRLRAERLTNERTAMEARAGGPLDDRAAWLTARRADVERDTADTRIQRAVTAKKLEAARAAAERVVGLERLRREADDLERRIQAAPDAQRARMTEQLATLREKIDELSKTSPSLDSAREEVFRLEVDLVGLEARSTVLGEERTELSDALTTVLQQRTAWTDVVRQIGEVHERLAELRAEQAAAWRRQAQRGDVFEVIRAPGPPAKEERK